MFIDKHSIRIKLPNQDNWTDISDYLLEAKYEYNKLWSPDSGRNLAGKQSGTLIGIFPKIILQFRRLTQAEFERIVKFIDAPKQQIRYYDPYKKEYRGMSTYTGDYGMTNKHVISGNNKNEPFQVSFISVAKR